ncbi:CBS domain-containing protein [Roseateles depolymerans]|uniref:CBS domain-containing protein n=1 Tax=Roseateles depolymerans TaxID=76731 RepID=A0A0U3N6S1_9BURK|nr:CBS domain-containing protein [Roseateles depolymerans]ALV07899.1 CBS domain-containing protein [Roseateles depolymerans]REG21880.1 CBS domain protein [Roseateles depolymerans]
MKPVSELLKNRGPSVWRISPEATVFDALHLLAEHDVGALLVMENDRLLGIFSERDYTRKIALQGRDSRHTLVSEVMTPNVLVVKPTTEMRDCMSLMSQRKIRHLPVMEGDQVIGMLSIRDLMNDIIADDEMTIAQLQSYIYG